MIGDACNRSRALPRGMFSVCGTSKRTISPSSIEAHQWAVVAPTLPAPMTVIFARFICLAFRCVGCDILRTGEGLRRGNFRRRRWRDEVGPVARQAREYEG